MACGSIPLSQGRKCPEQFCRHSRLLPHLVPCGFHWNCIDCGGLILKEQGGESLRKSFHPLIIQKCPWLPSEGVCNLPHSESPQGTEQVLSKPFDSHIALAGIDCLGFLVEKSVSNHGGRSRSCHLPQTCPQHTKQVGVRQPLKCSHSTSRFLTAALSLRASVRGSVGRPDSFVSVFSWAVVAVSLS